MISVGVDPGINGAIVVLDDQAVLPDGAGLGLGWAFFRMPTDRDRNTGRTLYDIAGIKAILLAVKKQAGDDRLLATVEKLHALPAKFARKGGEERGGGGSIANFNRGLARGFEWMLRALEMPVLMVHPQTWQREMLRDVPDAGDTKERALAAAKRLIPSLKVEDLRSGPRATKAHDGCVDALLLALYGRWTMLGSPLEPAASERRRA